MENKEKTNINCYSNVIKEVEKKRHVQTLYDLSTTLTKIFAFYYRSLRKKILKIIISYRYHYVLERKKEETRKNG